MTSSIGDFYFVSSPEMTSFSNGLLSIRIAYSALPLNRISCAMGKSYFSSSVYTAGSQNLLFGAKFSQFILVVLAVSNRAPAVLWSSITNCVLSSFSSSTSVGFPACPERGSGGIQSAPIFSYKYVMFPDNLKCFLKNGYFRQPLSRIHMKRALADSTPPGIIQLFQSQFVFATVQLGPIVKFCEVRIRPSPASI